MIEIEIFRSGTHRSMQGEEIAFDEGRLDAIAQAYDPAAHRAPVVIGHPQTDDPAWGWVEGLERRGDRLLAKVDQVDPGFAELVRAGRYKAVSASFYKPGQGANPKPGEMYLRHLGFLGAQPPAVKGLRPASFAAAPESEDEAPATFDLSEGEGEEGAAEAPTPDSDNEQPGARPAETNGTTPKKEEPVPTTKPSTPAPSTATTAAANTPAAEPAKDRDSEIAAREAELVAREAAFAERERKVRRSENQAFLRELVGEGRPLPAEEGRLLDFMEALEQAGTADFGEAGSLSLAETFRKDILGGLKQQVDFSERAAADGEADETPSDPQEIAMAAAAFQEEQAQKGVHLTMTQAVAKITQKETGR